ncbi:MAG: hypothetical protein GY793_05085 [Proteobacteria bacterium]|nr:hypothetical protein [Pseudomonadota bacterium]
MINLLNNKKSKIIALALTFVFCMSGVANAINDKTVSEILESGITGMEAEYTGDDWKHLEEGVNSDWDLETDGAGVDLKTYYENREHMDLGGLQKYINTSDEIITLVEINASFNAGIGLGCDGLDLGLESLFEFNLGDILDYLPQYIISNLAVEALAQIYATPLISTVMDGIKSMNNFVAEMKQSSCNEGAIMERRDEIREEAAALCKKEAADYAKTGGKDKEQSYSAKCQEPGAIEAAIKRVQNMPKNLLSLPKSMGKIFESGSLHGLIGNAGGATSMRIPGTYRTISANRLIKAFIPNVSWDGDTEDGSDVDAPSEMEVDDIYDTAETVVNNLYIDLYNDIIFSMKKKGYTEIEDQKAILKMIQKYQKNIERYGPESVYTDGTTDDDDRRNYSEKTTRQRRDIKEEYTAVHWVVIKKSHPEGFKIGPKKGPDDFGHNGDNFTDLNKDANKDDNARDILDYAEKCWLKSPKDGNKNEGSYTWRSLYGNNIELFNYVDGADGNYTKLIQHIAKCKALASLDLVDTHRYMNQKNDLGEAYLRYKTADVTYAVTRSVVNFIQGKLDKAATESNEMLLKQCNAVGPDKMKRDAVYESTVNGFGPGEYRSCTDYADQNELPEGKQNALKNNIKSMGRDVELCKIDRDSAKDKFMQLQYAYVYDSGRR